MVLTADETLQLSSISASVYKDSLSTLSTFQLHNIARVITVIYTLVFALLLNQTEGLR